MENNKKIGYVDYGRANVVNAINKILKQPKGNNPFVTDFDYMRNKQYDLETILEVIENGKRINWNPYIVTKNPHPTIPGNFVFKAEKYQRDLIWTLVDKQNLIDSIYNRLNCGTIILRRRGYEELEYLADKCYLQLNKQQNDIDFKYDVVDGKQRLSTMIDFVGNKFTDSHGNYFKDLTAGAQREIMTGQWFNYQEIQENTEDKHVIFQFLRVNITGVPQSIKILNNARKLLQNLGSFSR